MSRSFVKTVVLGHGRRGSDHMAKKRASRNFRHANRQMLKKADDYETMLLHTDPNAVSNVWDFPSDGKVYLGIDRAFRMMPPGPIEDLFRYYYHIVGK